MCVYPLPNIHCPRYITVFQIAVLHICMSTLTRYVLVMLTLYQTLKICVYWHAYSLPDMQLHFICVPTLYQIFNLPFTVYVHAYLYQL